MSSMAADGVRAMLMRGGTSKGAFFLKDDLPSDHAERNHLLLSIMGSPDPRQIDGIGGAHPLTSKVAVVSRSAEPGVDIDYTFLQVVVDEPVVADTQTCGNLLAAVGPFAVERGLVRADDGSTTVRIRLLNTGDAVTETFATPGGRPQYAGTTAIDGVPGTAAAIEIEADEKPVLPTGKVAEEIAGHPVTLVDNGMPVVLLRAADLGVTGGESPEELEADAALAAEVERVRLEAGHRMGLGNVAEQTVPKVFLLSAPAAGGAIRTRGFIPKRVHTSIGVLMAASVAAGIGLPGAVGSELARLNAGPTVLEHPSGVFEVKVRVSPGRDGVWRGTGTSIRTARKLFDGVVFPREG
jgi:4-oxalomesaconate tautomerase